MPQIKILYVITKLELGGAQKQLLSLISHLDKEKFNPFLFTAQDGALFLEALSISGLTVRKSACLERAINPFLDLLALAQIYWFIKKHKIEIVHTHSSKAGILGRWAAGIAGAKVIVHTVHGWSFNDYQSPLARKLYLWLERFSAKFTTKIIVVSNFDKQRGLDNHIGSEDKYSLIRYGINYLEFGPHAQGIREEFGIKQDELAVGMVSCFKPQKAPQDFIELCASVNKVLPKVKFVLVGDGVLRKEIESLISKFNLQNQVILTGWRRDIPAILSAIDVFVLTSLWEGLPIAVLEALASSRPVVATDTGGIKEVIKEGENGFLVSCRDTRELFERLTALLTNEDLRRTLADNAKNSLDANFCTENMVKKSEALYEALVTAGVPSHAN